MQEQVNAPTDQAAMSTSRRATKPQDLRLICAPVAQRRLRKPRWLDDRNHSAQDPEDSDRVTFNGPNSCAVSGAGPRRG
jgi:hypothetical protein